MPTDDQRKAAAAKRAREYRERKRLERLDQGRRAQPNRPPATEARDGDSVTPTISAEVEIALAAMKWLQPSDGGAVALARHSARRIDSMVAKEDDRLASRISQETQTLIRVLHEIGGTPTVRMQHELRSMRIAARVPEGEDDRNDADEEQKQEVGATVSKFERPVRRR